VLQLLHHGLLLGQLLPHRCQQHAARPALLLAAGQLPEVGKCTTGMQSGGGDGWQVQVTGKCCMMRQVGGRWGIGWATHWEGLHLPSRACRGTGMLGIQHAGHQQQPAACHPLLQWCRLQLHAPCARIARHR
jgi:hypothetical protein